MGTSEKGVVEKTDSENQANLDSSYQTIIAECINGLKNTLPCTHINGCACVTDSLCDVKCSSNNHCVECLSLIFKEPLHRKRNYECEAITYTYMLRFLDRYASEIYKILDLCPSIMNSLQESNILSIGCGPATEAVGLERILREKNSSATYHGVDKNPIWTNIQNIVRNTLSSQSLTLNINNYSLDIEQILPQTQLLMLH